MTEDASNRQRVAADLRQRAEKMAQEIPDRFDSLSPDEIQRVLHELRVHQIELEMQNEELRRAQAELAAARARYFDVYDLASVGYCTVDEHGFILDINLTAAGLLGRAGVSIARQPLSKFIHREDQDIYDRFRKQLSATAEPQVCSLRMLTEDGAAFWAHLEADVLTGPDGVSGCRIVINDITARKQAEDGLRESEGLLGIFVRHVPAAVAMFDREMRYLQVSDRWCADFSLRSHEIVGRSHYEVFPDLPERWREIHRRCLSGETVRADEDCWERTGSYPTWLRWEMRPWGEKQGKPAGVLIFSEDITGRKQIEATLRESEATIRTLLETAAQAILAVDLEGVVVLANRMAEKMFGYGHNEMLGRPLEMLLPQGLRERHLSHRAEFAANPRARPMGIGLDLQGLRKDSTEFPIEVSLSTVQTSRGALAVAFVTDITTRKKADASLRNSEKELRGLAQTLLTVQEDERRRIARDLHDDVTQRLALLSIEIGKLAGGIPSSIEEMRK